MFYRVGVREACETDRCEFGLRGGSLRNHAWFVSCLLYTSMGLPEEVGGIPTDHVTLEMCIRDSGNPPHFP